MLTITELNEIRTRVRQHLSVRMNETTVKIVISSGTTAIAAGSRQIMFAALDEITKHNAVVQIEQRELDVNCDEQPAVLVVTETSETLYKRCTPEMVRGLVAQSAAANSEVAN
ncbi:MAG: hypothetical protein KGZ53_08380 [Peptococcaceae bacterium]|nr:hypothetical protein [Peptococcaceae bacterium]